MADSFDRSLKSEKCGCYGDCKDIKRLPTHVIIQRQLQDVIKSQAEMLNHLDESIQQQNSQLEETYIARETEKNKLNVLKKSIEDRYILKEDFIVVDSALKEERFEHNKTKHKLKEVTDKLDFSLGEIEILTKQLEREKASFDSSYKSIKNKLSQSNDYNRELEKKLTESKKRCRVNEEVIKTKDDEIRRLQDQVKQLQSKFKQKVGEIDVEKQQELYIAKMMEGKKTKAKALPKR
ncbi:hypothetical protein LOTGIDRAFT_231437 [Lottia gigantea]|uniref:Uncharacterized protein n=1 Tax=Lottia gigantea TaxID=225164 RepID=V4ATZ5_LOTGI|nr:hypothetical protein LOTGIDRAFT_231437 [Lottia gigantea]ESO98390.1 hypothetical protein LOTGIDRAFT_231437 [Lottia gigantea]